MSAPTAALALACIAAASAFAASGIDGASGATLTVDPAQVRPERPTPQSSSRSAPGGVVAYREGGNVFLHAADGSSRRQITTQGSAEEPYLPAGIADDGKLLASYGPSSSKTWFFFNPDGSAASEGPNLVPMKYCGLTSIGPIAARLDPSGGLVAYSYFCNYGAPSWNYDLRLTVDIPHIYTAGSNTPDIVSGIMGATWFGKRLVVSDGNGIFVQEDHPDSPFRTGFDGWLAPEPGYTLEHAEIARQGGRFLVELEDAAETTSTIVGTYTGTPPGGAIDLRCELGAVGLTESATFTADGNGIVWADGGGLKVGTIDLNSSDCLLAGSTRTLSATGSIARTSAYTLRSGGAGGPSSEACADATAELETAQKRLRKAKAKLKKAKAQLKKAKRSGKRAAIKKAAKRVKTAKAKVKKAKGKVRKAKALVAEACA